VQYKKFNIISILYNEREPTTNLVSILWTIKLGSLKLYARRFYVNYIAIRIIMIDNTYVPTHTTHTHPHTPSHTPLPTLTHTHTHPRTHTTLFVSSNLFILQNFRSVDALGVALSHCHGNNTGQKNNLD
jgi:hypothetical protein